MNTLPKPRSFLLLAAVAPVTLMLQLADVYAQPAKSEAPVVGRASAHDQREKINAWTVGLAGGLLEGAPIRLAAEMARSRRRWSESACPADRHPGSHRKREFAALSAWRGHRDHQF